MTGAAASAEAAQPSQARIVAQRQRTRLGETSLDRMIAR